MLADVIMFADDTSILISDQNYDYFKELFNHALIYLSKWFLANQLVLNVGKTNIVTFTPKSSCCLLNVKYAGQTLTELHSLKFFGVNIDNYLTWHTHIDLSLRRLRTASFAVRGLFHILSLDVLKTIRCILPFTDKI
jgi:hypothetical protein